MVGPNSPRLALGADAHVFFRVDAQRVTAEVLEEEGEGGETGLTSEPFALMNARVDPRTTARVGAEIVLAVDPSRFHFFDPETGVSLLLDASEASDVEPSPVSA